MATASPVGAEPALSVPVLSVVVVIVSDTTGLPARAHHLAGCLDALHNQLDPPTMEIIVPHHEHVDGLEEVRRRHPAVTFLLAPGLHGGGRASREHHDELRARGLAAARGTLVGLLEDHARPDPGWARAMATAHRADGAAIGGAIENGLDRPLNWAVYFCDFGRYQRPFGAGEAPGVSDANATYRRAALEAIRDVWREAFHETAVNAALAARGQSLTVSGDAVVYQHREGLSLGSALRERFVWGRSYAATRSALSGLGARMVYAVGSGLLPAVLLLRMAKNVLRKGRGGPVFARALPLTALLTVSWAAGELAGYLTGRAAGRSAAALLGARAAGRTE